LSKARHWNDDLYVDEWVCVVAGCSGGGDARIFCSWGWEGLEYWLGCAWGDLLAWRCTDFWLKWTRGLVFSGDLQSAGRKFFISGERVALQVELSRFFVH
jgi:hypothetical protein